MRRTVDPEHGNQHSAPGRNRPRRGFSRLARLGITLGVVAPAVLWAEPAAARIALNHNEAIGGDRRA